MTTKNAEIRFLGTMDGDLYKWQWKSFLYGYVCMFVFVRVCLVFVRQWEAFGVPRDVCFFFVFFFFGGGGGGGVRRCVRESCLARAV